MNKKNIIGAMAVFALLVGVSRFTDNRSPMVPSTEKTHSSASVPAAGGNNSVTIGNQIAGKSVTISSVSLEKKGFVVIHEKDGDLLGKILGSSALLEVGESSNVSIALSEALKSGKTYLAVLVVDNGDRRYLPGIDHPVMSNEGNGGPFKVEFSTGTGNAGAKNI